MSALPLRDPYYRSDARDDRSGAPLLTIWRTPREHVLVFADDFRFAVDAAGGTIALRLPEGRTEQEAALYLTGPVLGFLLRVRGIIALHASVAVVDGCAVAFAGPSGSGKSTSAAAFAARGCAVMTEDLAPLRDHAGAVWVLRGCGYVALRPEAAALVAPSPLPLLAAGWGKRRFEPSTPAAPPQHPLSAVYLLHGASPRAGIRPLCGAEALMRVLANVYGNRVLHDERRVQEIDVAQRLLATVPVRSLARGDASIPAFRTMVEQDLRGLRPPS